MPKSDSGISEVLEFWFADGMAKRWFAGAPEFDEEVRVRLGSWFERAATGDFDHWRETASGCVALCILLDQVPRNLFRGDGRAFATDPLARAVTRHAIEQGMDTALPQVQRLFLYLPLEHSESLPDQEEAVRLIGQLDEEPLWLDYAIRHRDVIARFGRFPHRNMALGRTNTDEETAFLKTPGSPF